ncbi:hypothetical protein PCE1_000282 [Barthelona sp. PCE]
MSDIEHTEVVETGNAAEDIFASIDDLNISEGHPLIHVLNAEYENQLKEFIRQRKEELKERRDQLRTMDDDLENHGVSLYTAQQNLARAQVSLEQVHTNVLKVGEEANAMEDAVEKLEEKLDNIQKDSKYAHESTIDQQRDLDRLQFTVQQVEEYKQAIINEIKLTQRAADKTEEELRNYEAEKQEQDFRIDGLESTKKDYENMLALKQAQYVAQQKERLDSHAVIAEARGQIEAMQAEKRALNSQWQSSLIGLQRRHEALSSINEAIAEQVEEIQAVDAEADATLENIREEQDKYADATSRLDRLTMERQSILKEFKKISDLKDKCLLRQEEFTKSINEKEEEYKVVEKQKKQLQTEYNKVQAEYDKFVVLNKQLDQDYDVYMSDAATIKSEIRNVLALIQGMQQRIFTEESRILTDENEGVRLDIDIFTFKKALAELEKHRDLSIAELKEKEEILSKLTSLNRSKADNIAKKQSRVQLLDRKLEALTSNVEEENLGPLEAQIFNYKKEINQFHTDNSSVEKQWLRFQTELVSIVTKIEAEEEIIGDVRNSNIVLLEKLKRMEGDHKKSTENSDNIRKTMKTQYGTMGKLSSIKSTNNDEITSLEDGYFNTESNWTQELSDLTDRAETNTELVNSLSYTDEDLSKEIISLQRIVQFWERKLEILKEKKEMMDPTDGDGEIKVMQRELHRMRVKVAGLDKTLAQANIHTSQTARRLKSRAASRTVSRTNTNSHVVPSLRNELKQLTRSTTQIRHEINQLTEEREIVMGSIQELSEETEALRAAIRELEGEIQDSLRLKQRNFDVISWTQRFTEKVRKLVDGKLTIAEEKIHQAFHNLVNQEAQKEKLLTVIQLMLEQYEHPSVKLELEAMKQRLLVLSELSETLKN